MENKKKMNKLNVLMVGCLLFGVVASGFLLMNDPRLKENVVVPEIIGNTVDFDDSTWHEIASYVNVDGKFFMKSKDGSLIPLGAEASVAAAGFLSIYFVNHSAAPATAYNDNTSTHFENWSENMGGGGLPAYSKSDGFNIQLKANTPFDVVIRCKFVRTAGPWNGTKWIGTNVRVNLTISGDFAVTNELGTWKESYNSSSSQSYYGNAYWGGASGYQLHPGTTITISSIVISAKY